MKNILILLPAMILAAACSHSGGSESDTARHGDNDAIGVSSGKIAEVTAIELKPSVFNHEIVSNGHVTASGKADVNFQAQGVISAVYVKNGQRVEKGQKLGALDTYKIENQLEKERNAVAAATLEMQDVLIGQGYDPEHTENVPQEMMRLARLRSGLEQAELSLAATRRELSDATLKAPIAGVVANLTTKPFNMTGSEPFCRIISDRGMEVEFTVIEGELAMLKPGDEVSVSPFSDPATVVAGRISEINPMVDANGMVKVWATIGKSAGLLDGMNVRVRVRRRVVEALVVPKSAVVLRSGRQVVFTLEDGKAIWNYVTTGLENLDQYTVTEGLKAGDKVIISGNLNLAHETDVELKIEN
ncbi:MAG: efflux RND transporter periplasmic adaptor subunit [Muribaculaceae bacterium]|nr:efflux RND transporter periplasmic adaptor subunit [Muribaculaceae bacterium]